MVTWLPRAFVAIIIVVVASAIAKGVKDLITASLGGLSYGRLLATIASVFILGLGIIAALNQIGVATTVTTPILITVLAIIAGIAIVGVGGGLIKPMQNRWDGWLNRAEQEAANISSQSRTYAGSPDVTQQTAPAPAQPLYPATDPTVPIDPGTSRSNRY